jgi:exopolysaccharide production protein ExoZ
MILNLQGLRGLAVFLVVFVHLDVILGRLGLSRFGYGGVDIFFVISGFIMVYTTKGRNTRPGEFFLQRLVRVVPIYWMLTFSVFALAVFLPQLLGATRADPVDLLKSLLFIPFERSNGLIEPVLFVGWTLNYEMFFYLIFAVCLSWSKSVDITVTALVCLVGYRLALNPTNLILHFYTSPLLLEFGLGMLIAKWSSLLPISAPPWTRPALLMIAAGAAVMVIRLPLYDDGLRFLAYGIPAAVLVTSAVALERLGWKTPPSFTLLGNASYSIYLTHPFVTQPFQKLTTFVPEHLVTTVALLIGTLLSVAMAGYVFFMFVEQPLTRILRKRFLTDRSKTMPNLVLETRPL